MRFNFLVALHCLFFAWVIGAEEPALLDTSPKNDDAPDFEIADGGHPNPLVRFFGAQIDAARAEKKPLVLAVFNSEAGADTKALRSSTEWKARVSGKYIVMPLDLRGSLLEKPEYLEMTTAVSTRYVVNNVPAMVFLDDELLPIGQIHTTAGKDAFFAGLDKIEAEAKEREEYYKKRAAFKLEEAKLIDAMIEKAQAMNAPVEALRGPIDEILDLDAQDKGGFRGKYTAMAQLLDAQALLDDPKASNEHVETLIRYIDEKKLSPKWQEQRISLWLRAIVTAGNLGEAQSVLDAGLAIPNTEKSVQQSWILGLASAFAMKGDAAKSAELTKKGLALDPESKIAKMYAASDAKAPDAETATPKKAIISTHHDHKPFDLASVKGKPVVIEFWSKSNKHSHVAMTASVDLATEYKDKVLFLAVNVGDTDDCEEMAREFPHMTWLDDATGLLEDTFDVKRAPYTLLLDKEGKRAAGVNGLNLFNRAVIETKLEELLK